MNKNTRNGGLVGLLVLAMFAGAARAEVVVHDNTDGTFKWTRTWVLSGDDPLYGTFLDIRQPPTQSGERKPGTFGSYFYVGVTSSSPGIFEIEREGSGSAHIARSDTGKTYVDWNGDVFTFKAAREYAVGESVQSSDDWITYGAHYFSRPFSFEFAGGVALIEPLAYLGVRVKAGTDKYNYGWILFKDWTHPVMWAYETEPNVPIQIPVPAPAGSMAAFLAFACFSRTPRRMSSFSLHPPVHRS